ncbi:anhydro-N-acetylmuramic acid kinase [Mesoterricola sediminis]|uniref:Anhydro-N-acetylmuramic acid kinase n=1 Tax=Mesoterricola sediminis TaxID=2927980 RepID=A0AA48GWR1_9BACT|nr:anhydro-N-acetylmuramic acid kinase [Mesoterricola sediminis]BDU77684.1 anhydro-N-acetylmuramic acid kinase [Mesoterricola sediminis]
MEPARLLPDPGPWTVLGLMSGTSADGADAALVRIDPEGFRGGRPFLDFLGHVHHPYGAGLRERVLAAAADALPPSELCALQRELGDHHARTGRDLAERLGLRPTFAALHGQTVQHRPAAGATLQLADPYVLAEALGCPVVWDLRRRDMALGGQGAPLVPLAERWLHGAEGPWIALNLGGIANATVWDGTRTLAWDLGPAMSLLDLAAARWLGQPFDPDGAQAQGEPDDALLRRWLDHPHFHLPPPKSTGREVFGAAWLRAEEGALDRLPLARRLATLAAFTAEACARELRTHAPALPGAPLLLSGGGAKHQAVRRGLAERLPEHPLVDDLQFPPGAREAVSWALLGAASAVGVPANLPEVTGAARAAVLGSWVPR